MNVFVVILIIITAFSGGVEAIRHGEPKNDKYNFGRYLISISIIYLLLYLAGLFD